MNTNTLRKHYENLTDLERFRLALAAAARDDESESRAIRETASVGTYKMLAWPYHGMLEWSERMIAALAMGILGDGYLMMVAALACAVNGESREVEARETVRVSARRIVVAWDGFAAFCEELGLDPIHVTGGPCLGGRLPVVVRTARGLLAPCDTEGMADEIATWIDALRENWQCATA